MREEETNDNELDGKLRDYFRAEDLDLETPLDLWHSISPRLGQQRRPGWRRRLLAVVRLEWPSSDASTSIPFWAPKARKALAVGMVLIVAVGLVYLGVSLTTDGDTRPDAQVSRAVSHVEIDPEAATGPIAIATAAPTSIPATSAPQPAGGPVALTIGVNGDALAFNTASLSAASGSEVVVTLNNSSSVNTHNWALVEAGTKDAVATDGLAAGQDNNWLPVGDSRVLGSTILVGPGESAQATFTAPAAGTYQFVCTFPGPNFTMFGEFIVN